MFERPSGGQRALIVHIKLRDPRQTADISEFKCLAESAGAFVVSVIVCPRSSLDPKYLIGKGKLEEINSFIKSNDVNLVLFNHKLTPTQERNLEKDLGCGVLDRTGLILDIFACRARTYEGKLQVELAQLVHLSTRLIRGWTHLERQKGGIGLRGPGETQLETDRRLIKNRITNIKNSLTKVRRQRQQSRSARQKAKVPTVSLVGYTNAGKSTLFNVLTKANVYAKDQLFATLDPTLRIIELPHFGKAILADTVGFIRDLPHELIDAFRATLDEVADADLILHVINSADCSWEEQKRQVEVVLSEINAMAVPILEVYNKIDLESDIDEEPEEIRDHDGIIRRVRVSAKKGVGLTNLQVALAERLSHDIVKGVLKLQPQESAQRAMLYSLGAVDNETTDSMGVSCLTITLPKLKWDRMCRKFPRLKDALSYKED